MRRVIWLLAILFISSSATAACATGPPASSAFTLRPNKPGDESNIPYQSPRWGEHWDKLDEADPDEDTTSLNAGKAKGWYRDLYHLDDIVAAGTIRGITVSARLKNNGMPAGARIALKTGGVVYEGSIKTLTESYADYSETWATNPQTGSAWTWPDINTLQAGVSLQYADYGDFQGTALLTQLYVRDMPSAEKEGKMTLSLLSTAFKEGDRIPVKYSCDGQDVSPPLAWSEPPPGTRAFALIVDDPDAPGGVFTHWVLFNIPVDTRQLGEGLPGQERLQDGALQGRNDFGKIGYGGPCPPFGTHRYRFRLYALDKALDAKPGVSKKQILDAVKGHILAQGQLTAAYERRSDSPPKPNR